MSYLRAPARFTCWVAAFAAGSPVFWLGAFLMERHAHESPMHVLWRAKVYTNLWLMLGATVWYLAWSFGTLLLPRHAVEHRHARPLHRWFDTAIVVLIPAVGILFWMTGDPDPRNFRRMMPTDSVFVPAALFAGLNVIVCCQICCLERLHPFRHANAEQVEPRLQLLQNG